MNAKPITKPARVLAALVLLAAALGAAAEPPGGFGEQAEGRRSGHHHHHQRGDGWMKKMAQRLELDAAQMAQVDSLLEQNREQIKSLRERKHALHKALHDSGLETLTEADIAQHSQEVGAIAAEKSRVRLQTKVAFHQLLTPVQRERMQELREERRERHREWQERRGDQKPR